MRKPLAFLLASISAALLFEAFALSDSRNAVNSVIATAGIFYAVLSAWVAFNPRQR